VPRKLKIQKTIQGWSKIQNSPHFVPPSKERLDMETLSAGATALPVELHQLNEKPKEMPLKDANWLPISPKNIPTSVVFAGWDTGERNYVARVRIQDEVIPGKAFPRYSKAYFSHDGTEKAATYCEVRFLAFFMEWRQTRISIRVK
jgi:Protein of unknown function (DUF3421)